MINHFNQPYTNVWAGRRGPVLTNIWARIPATTLMKLRREQDQAAPWWKRITG